VLSPLGKNFYLNITPNNLVHLYLRSDAIAEGSPTSVRIRELNSSDFDAMAARATESLCNRRHQSSIQPLVTNCISGNRQIAPDCATVRNQYQQNIVTNPVHKQSLSELVTSLRNCSSVRTQAPNQSGISSTHANQSLRSAIPQSSCGSNHSMLEANSLHHLQTAPLKLHDQSKLSDSSEKYISHFTAADQALTASESPRLQTPGQVMGAKFHFKRTPTTPVQSHVQLSVHAQQTTTSSRVQSCTATVGVTPGILDPSLMFTSVSPTLSAISQAANSAVDDVWITGLLEQSFFILSVTLVKPHQHHIHY